MMFYFRYIFIFQLIIELHCVVFCSAQPGYVTLEGRQFKLNGENFYPLAFGYCFNLVYNDEFDVDEIYLSRENGYGPGYHLSQCPDRYPNYEYEFDDPSECYDQIADDLTDLKTRGFNVFRTCGIGIKPVKDNMEGFRMTARKNVHPLWSSETYNFPIFPPYTNNVNINPAFFKYCQLIQEILNVAGEAGLKVMLDVGDSDYAYSEGSIADYSEFLEAIAFQFKEDTNLMAYVIFEEPTNTDPFNHTKAEVCEFTSTWYESIRGVDPNHLITMGVGDVEDVWEWDPVVIKTDFLCPHPYPHTYMWENFEFQPMYKRMLGRLIWLQRNCPLPWMIGEMAYSALDDNYIVDNSNNWVRVEYSAGDVDGSLEDQQEFAEHSLMDVINCGGSGYTWWQALEPWWGPRDDGFGLLRHDSYEIASPPFIVPVEKPALDEFEDFPVPPPEPVPVQVPTNYTDPFNGTYQSISGHVQDEENQPVDDAVVLLWNWKDPEVDNIFFYGLTGMTGDYFIRNPLYSENNYFNQVKISAVGYSSMTYTTDTIPPTINATLVKHLYYDELIEGETVSLQEQAGFSAINSVTFQGDLTLVEGNGISGGELTVKARNEITISPGFEAQKGSSVHLLTGPFLFDCETWPATLNKQPTIISTINDLVEKVIQLKFEIPRNQGISVFPNPCKDQVTIEWTEVDREEILTTIEIFNPVGQLIHSFTSPERKLTLNLNFLPDGFYVFKCRRSGDLNILKLIKQ